MRSSPLGRLQLIMLEAAEMQRRLAAGAETLAKVREQDVAIATTPKTRIMQRDKVTLDRYVPQVPARFATPVLMVYGLIGRYTMADLQPDRSLVRNLLAEGADLFVVDWGEPGRPERWLTLDDYICDYLDACVAAIRREAGCSSVTLLGICEGGVFALCYAALNRPRVKNLILTITPVDFHADQLRKRLGFGYINVWIRSLAAEDIDLLVETLGVLPGEFMGGVFSMMTPLKSITKYNLDLLEILDDEAKLLNFMRMEKWLADRPDHPGEAAKQWLKHLYQNNLLFKGEFRLDGQRVDLAAVTMPVLNIFAEDDHIIPPECAKALKAVVGTRDYTELPLPGGHIGLFVGGKSQGLVGRSIGSWLASRD